METATTARPAWEIDAKAEPPNTKLASRPLPTPSTGWLVLLVVIAAALPFLLSCLRNGFVYDDDAQILNNTAIHSWHAVLPHIVPTPSSRDATSPINDNSYRPMFYLWLRANDALFGLRPRSWHIASLCLHLGVTALVFLLLWRQFRDAWVATAGALLFGIHPAHIESVVRLSGAADSLAALGILGSLLLWMRNQESPRARLLIGSLACYAAGLLSNEIAIILPTMIFLYAYLGGTPGATSEAGSARERFWMAIRKTLPFVGVSISYVAARLAAPHGFRAEASWISGGQAILTIPWLMLFYLRHLVWPVGLSVFYDLAPVASVLDGAFWLPLLCLAAIAAGGLLWWRRRGDSAVPVAAAWIVLPLLPVLDVAIFGKADFDFGHDRCLYLPSIGLAVAAAMLFKAFRESHWPPSRRVSMFGATLLLAALAASTAMQAQNWRDDVSLYSYAVKQSNNPQARLSLAEEYALDGKLDEADALLTPLVKELPDSWAANYDFGSVNYRLKRLDLAEQCLRKAIAINPQAADPYLYLGLTYLRDGRSVDAAAQLRNAIARNPQGANYHLALGIILQSVGDLAQAKAELLEELKNYPHSVAVAQLTQVNRAIAIRDTRLASNGGAR